MYLITRVVLGVQTALIASFLVALSQYNIAASRKVSVLPFLIFLSLLSLFLFYKAVVSKNVRLLFLNGIVMGVAFWFYENIVFLFPIYVIFLFIHSQYRFWLRNKYLWLSFIFTFFISLPLILANLFPGAHRFSGIYDSTTFGLSLNSLGLYIGELILIIIKPFPKLFNYAAISVDPHYPPGESIILGLLILVAVIKYRKNNTNIFLNLLWVCFLFNFILFCFLRRNDMIQSFWSLGSFMWGILGLIPGIILSADRISKFINKHASYGRLLFFALAFLLLIKAWDMATYPLNCFFPFKDYCLDKRKLDWEINYDYPDDIAAIKDTLGKVYIVALPKSEYKLRAASKLAQILVSECKYKNAKEYLDYILSQDPNNKNALNMLGQISNAKCNN